MLSSQEINVMVDLETMSTRHDAAIASIGAVKFTLERGIDHSSYFYMTIELDSCEAAGLHFSGRTIQWWLGQSEAARKALLVPGFQLKHVLDEFQMWFPKDAPIWGNGATFDNVILRSAYKAMGIRAPWHYRGDRCFRTAVALLPKVEYNRHGEHHNALDDALTQADYLCRAWAAWDKTT